ncbi:VOC family protein, partial [Thermobaculum terrenum]|uniref:VOC family protein n=1 Tax=Thermobaculum terrenum TaxID=166501 RepID=UPI00019BF16E
MVGRLITRLDHVVVAVRDLQRAMEKYRERGFDVQPGGRHTGRGTENAIIRLGLEHIELISLYDRREAEEVGIGRRSLVEYLDRWDGGIVDWAVATD